MVCGVSCTRLVLRCRTGLAERLFWLLRRSTSLCGHTTIVVKATENVSPNHMSHCAKIDLGKCVARHAGQRQFRTEVAFRAAGRSMYALVPCFWSRKSKLLPSSKVIGLSLANLHLVRCLAAEGAMRPPGLEVLRLEA